MSGSAEDEYRLDSTAGSIALNKVSEGNELASVKLEDAGGNLVSTDTLLGQPLIVNFWFSTCEPCRREFPVLVAADAQFNHIRFVGVNISDTQSERASAAALATARLTPKIAFAPRRDLFSVPSSAIIAASMSS